MSDISDTMRIYEIIYYELPSGNSPFMRWFNKQSNAAKHIISVHLERIQSGYFGSRNKYLGKGVSELKFYFGSAYRVYYGLDHKRIVLLLGGDKGTQKKDIRIAQKYWQNYLSEVEDAS